jgi:ribosomal protein L29
MKRIKDMTRAELREELIDLETQLQWIEHRSKAVIEQLKGKTKRLTQEEKASIETFEMILY